MFLTAAAATVQEAAAAYYPACTLSTCVCVCARCFTHIGYKLFKHVALKCSIQSCAACQQSLKNGDVVLSDGTMLFPVAFLRSSFSADQLFTRLTGAQI